jgi:hypothetical protein
MRSTSGDLTGTTAILTMGRSMPYMRLVRGHRRLLAGLGVVTMSIAVVVAIAIHAEPPRRVVDTNSGGLPAQTLDPRFTMPPGLIPGWD